MSGSELKEYIGLVYKLESSLYKQQLLIDKLARQKEIARDPKWVEKEVNNSSKGGDIFGGIVATLAFTLIGGAIGFVLLVVLLLLSGLGYILDLFFDGGFINFLKSINEAEWLIPVLVIAGALIGFLFGVVGTICEVSNGVKGREATIKDNNRADEANRRIAINAKAKIANLEQQINKAKVSYAQTEARLKKAYGMNIIHPKYHGLEPISRFYEYFDTGMCSTLEGHEGAYVLYENEIRLDKIISGIEDIKYLVETQSEQIRKNQYMIYQAVREGIDVSNRVNNAIAECNNRLANIENNTEVTRYYSGITAINTTFDTWYNRH